MQLTEFKARQLCINRRRCMVWESYLLNLVKLHL